MKNSFRFAALSSSGMVTSRRFAQLQKGIAPPRMNEIPDGGFCLSTFLIISKTGFPNHVLMGHINKSAKWDHIGALDAERVERHSKGWMLPSSHLILGEAPQEAAARILKEQLGLTDQKLDGPLIFSETYGTKNHWDLEFLFLGERNTAPSYQAWIELRFIDLTKTGKEEISRGHEDVLGHVHKWSTAT